MKPLSGLDGAFLNLETPDTPMHVGSLHLFETPSGYRRDFRSYAGTLRIGFTAARCAVPYPQELVVAILSEYDELRRRGAPA